MRYPFKTHAGWNVLLAAMGQEENPTRAGDQHLFAAELQKMQVAWWSLL